MKDEDRLRRFEVKQAAQVEAIKATKEVAIALVSNPLIDMVAGVLILEYAERKGYAGPVIVTTTEIGLLGVATAQALAPIVPQLLEGAAGAAKVVAMIK